MEFKYGTLAEVNYKFLRQGADESPLIYLIHGRAGNREVMWAFRRTLPEGCNVVALEANHPDPAGGFSWWQVSPVLADRQAMLRAVDLVRNFTDSFERTVGLRPTRRLAIGFSQGAGLISIIIQKQPELFGAVALLAGFVIPLNQPVLSGPAVFIAHGTQDPVVSIEKAHESKNYLEQLGLAIEFHEEPVTHKIGAASMRALKNWLLTQL